MKIYMIILLLLPEVDLNISGDHPNSCPGLYCSRTIEGSGNLSACGACPKGFQRNSEYVCERCDGETSFYMWLYLGFMAMLVPGFHWFCIDFTTQRRIGSSVALHISALVESVLAGFCTLLVSEPRGSLTLLSCPINALSDWYPVFYNPTTDYVHTIHCTYEVVYPLYTIVMIYYAFCLLFLILIRPLVSDKCTTSLRSQRGCTNCGTKSIYSALYFLPILIVIQAVFGGLIYYSFPYILLLFSLVTNALHFAWSTDQTPKALLQRLRIPRNLIVLFAHWLLHGYSIIGITGFDNPRIHGLLLLLVPCPAIFYMVTVHYTDPLKLDPKRD